MPYFVIYVAEDYVSIEEKAGDKLLAAIAPNETGESRDYGVLTFLTGFPDADPLQWPIRSMMIIEGRIITPEEVRPALYEDYNDILDAANAAQQEEQEV